MKPKTIAVKNPTIVNLLRRARNLIRTRGFVQHTLCKVDATTGVATYCVRGAVMAAQNGATDRGNLWNAWDASNNVETADRFVGRAAGELFPSRTYESAVDFNNHEQTTKADLLRVLGRAVELAKVK